MKHLVNKPRNTSIFWKIILTTGIFFICLLGINKSQAQINIEDLKVTPSGNFQITKTADKDATNTHDDIITYKLEITNKSTTDTNTPINIKNTLPAGLKFVEGSISIPPKDDFKIINPQNIDINNISVHLSAGATGIITYKAKTDVTDRNTYSLVSTATIELPAGFRNENPNMLTSKCEVFIKPEVTNQDISFCSGEDINIPLESTLSNYPTTYQWSAINSTEDITNFQTSGNTPFIKISGKNTKKQHGEAVYTVTPSITTANGNIIRGNAKNFTVKILPKSRKLDDDYQHLINVAGMNYLSQLEEEATEEIITDVTYKWYKDKTSTTVLHQGIDQKGGMSILGEFPDTKTYFVTTQEKGKCESRRAKVVVQFDHNIILSLNKTQIDAGQTAILTAKIANLDLKAPAKGIYITLNFSDTALSGVNIFIPAGSNAASVNIETNATADLANDTTLTINGTASGGYIIEKSVTLVIQHKTTFKPEITNNKFEICSGEEINIPLGSTHRWTTNYAAGARSGSGTAINQTLTNFYNSPVTAIYTTKDILSGKTTTFSVTVKAKSRKPEDEDIFLVTNSPYCVFSGSVKNDDGRELSNVMYRWYASKTTSTVLHQGIDKKGDITIQTEFPTNKTLFVTTQEENLCESERATAIIKITHNITLSLNKSFVNGGEASILTASISKKPEREILKAPKGGITLNLDLSGTAVNGKHYKKLLNIFIPEGSNSASVPIETNAFPYLDDEVTLSIKGTATGGYLVVENPIPILTIKYTPERPKITNTVLDYPMNSGSYTDIPLKADKPNTTFEWTPTTQSDLVKGFSPDKGSQIHQLLTSGSDKPEVVTYRITPKITTDNGKIITGDPVDFIITVIPLTRAKNIAIENIDQPSVDINFEFDSLVPHIPETYLWYTDENCTQPLKPTPKRSTIATPTTPGAFKTAHAYNILTPEPGQRKIFAIGKAPNSSNSRPTIVQITTIHTITLAFKDNEVDGGKSTELIASLPESLIAPKDGIKIALNYSGSAKTNNETPSFIDIPAGKRSASVIVPTLADNTITGEKLLTITGSCDKKYTFKPAPTLKIHYLIKPEVLNEEIKPEILNNELEKNICSNQPLNINFELSPTNATCEWTATSFDKDVIGITNGTGKELNQVLSHSSATSQKVIYTVTPIVSIDSKIIKGDPKKFTITIIPCDETLDTTLSASDDPSTDQNPEKLTPDNTKETTPTETPKIELVFVDQPINGGNTTRLTAKLPPGTVAPTEGVEITLKPLKNESQNDKEAIKGINYTDLAAKIVIPAGKNEYSIDAFTTLNGNVIDGETTLTLTGKATNYKIKPAVAIIKDKTGDTPESRTFSLTFLKPLVQAGKTAKLRISLPNYITSAHDIPIHLSKLKNESTAKQGKNYTVYGNNYTINFPANENSIEIPIQTLLEGDSDAEKLLAIHGESNNYIFTKSKLLIQNPKKLRIPNTFTPNNNGHNDVWKIEGADNYPNITIQIFNRWGGTMIFSSSGHTKSWDGTYKQTPCPSGVYFYIINLHNGTKPIIGSVSIIR